MKARHPADVERARSRRRRPGAGRRRAVRGRDLFGARPAHRQRRALGRDRPERRRQVVAAGGDSPASLPLAAGGVRLDGRPLADWPLARSPAARLEPAVLVRPVPGDRARDGGARARPRQLGWRSASTAERRCAGADRLLDRLDLDAPGRHRRASAFRRRAAARRHRDRPAPGSAAAAARRAGVAPRPGAPAPAARPPRDHARQGGAVLASLHDLNLAWDLADHASSSTARAAPCAGPRDRCSRRAPERACSSVTIESVEPHGAFLALRDRRRRRGGR